MDRINAWWARGPSTRTVAIWLALAAVMLAVRWYVVAPIFSQDLGFIPFDLQPRLNQGMLVIQMGAARGHPLAHLYGAFVMSDIPVSLVLAVATVLFWRWLHLKAPNRVTAFLTGGGIMLLPMTVAAFEMAEHRAVFGMLQQRGQQGYAGAVELMVTLHNIKSALAEIRDTLSLIFLATTAVLVLLRRKSPGTQA